MNFQMLNFRDTPGVDLYDRMDLLFNRRSNRPDQIYNLGDFMMTCSPTMSFSLMTDKMSRPASPSCVVSLAEANYSQLTSLTLSALDDILGDFQFRSTESSTHTTPTLTETSRRKRQRTDREDAQQQVAAFLSSSNARWNDLVQVGHRASDEHVARSATYLGLDSCSLFIKSSTRLASVREGNV